MRDKRFIAEHRGGLLKKEDHRQLIKWACKCARHILKFLGKEIDDVLQNALEVAKQWEKGKVKTGEAMKAARKVHAAAREYSDPITVAAARAIGHAVGTAHCADHSLGASLYALKTVKLAKKQVDKERKWQDNQLPEEIKELVISGRKQKEKHFKL